MEHMTREDLNTLVDLLNSFCFEVNGDDCESVLNIRDMVEAVRDGEYENDY